MLVDVMGKYRNVTISRSLSCGRNDLEV